VLHATEGVWGFACDPFNAEAVQKVIALKGRAADKGLIVIAATAAVFSKQMSDLTAVRCEEIMASWPGPHTWILHDNEYAPVIRGFRDTLACRVPGHPQARALCQQFGAALVSTSANLAGEPGITTLEQARQSFGGKVDYLLSGAVLNPGRASTIHALDGEILR